MNKKPYLVISKIEVIQKTDKVIKRLIELPAEEGYESVHNSSIKTMVFQKRKLIKELLIEMISAKLSFTQFKSLYEKIFAYLEKEGAVNIVLEDWQKNINEAEEFLIAN